MIPPKIVLANNSQAEADFIGLALSQLAILERLLSFHNVNSNYRRVDPYPGVLLEAWKTFSIREAKITVDEDAYNEYLERPEKKRYERKLDNRFFVRIGAPTDMVFDERGHLVSDTTRYYWIDFAARPDAPVIADQIAFHDPGERTLEFESGEGYFYAVSRNVSHDTFSQAVTFTDYMYHNYVRSFDLAKDIDGLITQRFVAGYHFLATGNNIVYTPTVVPPSGGDFDEYEICKNPPNRFFVDLESRTMCWYHVLQEWKLLSVVTDTESTGSISGDVVGADFTENVLNLDHICIFSFTGNAADAQVTETAGDSLLEPIGIASDIEYLDRTSLKIITSYESVPVRLNCTLGASPVVSSVDTLGAMTTALAVADGYEWYQSATVVIESGDEPDILAEDTAVVNSYDVNECLPLPAVCNQEIEIIEDGGEYSEIKSAWEETIVNLSLYGMDSYGYTEVVLGRENGTYAENVYSILHYCYPVLGGNCNESGYSTAAARSVQGYASGSFGSICDVSIPCQNITIHRETNDKVINTSILRIIQGPGGEGVLSEDLAHWNASTPLQTDDPPFDICSEVYPAGYTMEDPANWLPLGNFPISLDDLVFNYASGNGTYSSNVVYNYDQTVTVDKCYVKDCPDEFTASGLISIVILDDRWSRGSQGQVIAVKSSTPGETAIYHNGVDKMQAILEALTRDSLLGDGENLYDIGLI